MTTGITGNTIIKTILSIGKKLVKYYKIPGVCYRYRWYLVRLFQCSMSDDVKQELK